MLSAEWDTPVLSPVSTDEGLVAISTPVVEGRWRRARTGYHLWVGIDAHVLTAIAVQAPHLRSYVPFVDRSTVDLSRHDGELYVTVGNYRREIVLPRVLAGRDATNATILDGELRVRFTRRDAKAVSKS